MTDTNTTPDNSTPHVPKFIYDFDPHNLPSEYLRAVGLVAMASAQTEHILGQFIGALLKIDGIQSLALTSHMSIPLRDNIIRAVAELDAPNIKELDRIDDLMDAVTSAFDKRNTILHNSFVIHPETKEVLSWRLKTKGSMQLELKPVTVNEMEQDATALYEVGMDIVRFMDSRGLCPYHRTKPLNAPINRGKKARAERRNTSGGNL